MAKLSIDDVTKIALRKYGSLAEPDFRFVSQELENDSYADLRESLLDDFEVEDITDPNTDVSFGYKVRSRESGDICVLRLSLLGPYAVLIRCTRDGLERVIIDESQTSTPSEQLLLRRCLEHKIPVLDIATLQQPIGLVLFDTSPGRVKVYQVLFEDREFIPSTSFRSDTLGGRQN